MAAQGTGITISGLDDCLKLFDNAPENLVKAARAALREASKATSKSIRQRVPKRWRRMVKYKVSKTSQGSLNACLGLFNGHQHNGHQNAGNKIDDWFKAYWANYGTLEHRDGSHHFQSPVKRYGTRPSKKNPKVSVNIRRNNAGQAAENFFERAINGYETDFVQAFSEALQKQEKTLYQR